MHEGKCDPRLEGNAGVAKAALLDGTEQLNLKLRVLRTNVTNLLRIKVVDCRVSFPALSLGCVAIRLGSTPSAVCHGNRQRRGISGGIGGRVDAVILGGQGRLHVSGVPSVGHVDNLKGKQIG